MSTQEVILSPSLLPDKPSQTVSEGQGNVALTSFELLFLSCCKKCYFRPIMPLFVV